MANLHPFDLSSLKSHRGTRAVSARKNARIALFARLWTGSIKDTIMLCQAEGMAISDTTATTYLRDPRFIDLMREGKASRPGSGVWNLEELQQHLTRVAAGIEQDGHSVVMLLEPIVPGEDDYDHALAGQQWRKVKQEVPNYPKMSDRLKAADLLGRSLGAFTDKIELTGDMKVSVLDLLDDDLKEPTKIVNI